ncbi:hypothetical protein Tco_0554828 [Tanacetum coccineum]
MLLKAVLKEVLTVAQEPQKKKEPYQPLVSIHVVTEMHKDASQTTRGQMSLGTTGEVKANPQLSSVVSAFTSKLIVTISIIVHSKSASRGDASASLTAGADLGLALRIQRMKPNLLDQDGDDLVRLMPKATKGIFMEWDSLNDDQPIDVSSEDQAEFHMGTNDTSIPISPPASPKTLQIKDLYNYVLFLQSQKGKLEEEKQAIEAETALLKAHHHISTSISLLKSLKTLGAAMEPL